MHTFDKDYWEDHWGEGASARPEDLAEPVSPYLVEQTRHLAPGTALDAGCGTGAEAVWLASQGWLVTGADISSAALDSARQRGHRAGAAGRLSWVEADLTTWEPPQQYDLVSSHYAHATIPQLQLYQRLAQWVAAEGVMIIVGHLHQSDGDHEERHASEHGSAHALQHPDEATVTADEIAATFDATRWRIEYCEEVAREVAVHGERRTLHDAVVVAVRLR